MIRFETEAYFKDTGVSSFFYPYVEVGQCNVESTEAKRWVSWAKLSNRQAEPPCSSTVLCPNMHSPQCRHCGLMVSALNPRLSSSISRPGQG